MNKIGGVVVSHGQLATELLSAAETVVGPVEHIQAVSIGWHDDVDMAKDEIERAIKQADQGSGVIVLTDMFGGTPTNISAMFLKEGRSRDRYRCKSADDHQICDSRSHVLSSNELATEIEEQGKQSIYRTSAIT